MSYLNIKDVISNKNEAINNLNTYLDNCIMQDNTHLKKANLLSYWIKTNVDYLQKEETFNSYYLKEYSRGDIIKVNLGFNIGNEEGGLHYCVVLDKKNAKSYSTLTVVPLTSVKPTSKIHNTSVFLGNEIYSSLSQKAQNLVQESREQINTFKQEIQNTKKLPSNTEEEKIIKDYKIKSLTELLNSSKDKADLIQKINDELEQMKNGSIALVNQITTISKLRIYNPKKNIDILSGIKLSNERMSLIDEKIKKLYVN